MGGRVVSLIIDTIVGVVLHCCLGSLATTLPEVSYAPGVVCSSWCSLSRQQVCEPFCFTSVQGLAAPDQDRSQLIRIQCLPAVPCHPPRSLGHTASFVVMLLPVLTPSPHGCMLKHGTAFHFPRCEQ